MTYLTIAIPTYNRAEKLKKTLNLFFEYISSDIDLFNNIEVIVSNNASEDSTIEILECIDKKNINFKYFNQESNIGLDRNMEFLYQMSQGKYVWYFSDDDVIFVGSIERILGTLKNYTPEVLLFSFTQPAGSLIRIFNYKEEVKIFQKPNKIIEFLVSYPKLSIYIYKNQKLDANSWKLLEKFYESNYFFIALGFSILERTKNPSLAIISEPLAGCDADFNKIRFTPETWGTGWIPLEHPYPKSLAPDFIYKKKKRGYFDQIQALYAYKSGAWIVTDPLSYEAFIAKMKLKPLWLVQKPKALVQIIVLKLGLVDIWVRFFSRSHKNGV